MSRPTLPTRRQARHLAQRMPYSGVALLPLAGAALLQGRSLHHRVEDHSWSSALLNSARLPGGMGPVDTLHTEAGRWLAGLYALFAGLVFLVVAGVMLSPVIHHVLEHVAAGQPDGPRPGPDA